jgi:hypothetical protein
MLLRGYLRSRTAIRRKVCDLPSVKEVERQLAREKQIYEKSGIEWSKK